MFPAKIKAQSASFSKKQKKSPIFFKFSRLLGKSKRTCRAVYEPKNENQFSVQNGNRFFFSVKRKRFLNEAVGKPKVATYASPKPQMRKTARVDFGRVCLFVFKKIRKNAQRRSHARHTKFYSARTVVPSKPFHSELSLPKFAKRAHPKPENRSPRIRLFTSRKSAPKRSFTRIAPLDPNVSHNEFAPLLISHGYFRRMRFSPNNKESLFTKLFRNTKIPSRRRRDRDQKNTLP